MKKLYFLMVLFVLISLRIQGQVVFSESFDDDAFPSGWTAIDADGDNHNWVLESFNPHSGTGHFASASYDNAILFPDNWLISPLIELPAGAELSFWVVAQDSDWVGEHWGVYISTEEEISISDFVSLYQAVSAPSTYEQVTIDLSDYAGQSVRIAFRHYNCSDQFWLNIDDVTISVEQMCNLMIEYYVDPSSQVAEGDWLSVFAGGAYMGGVSSYNYSSTGHDIVTVPVPAGVTLNFEWQEPVEDHNSYFAVFDPMDERMVFVKEYGGTLPDGQAGTYTSTCGASCTAEDKCPLHVSMSRTPGNGYGDYTVFVTLEGMDMGELVLTQEQSSLDTTLYFCPGRLVELYANGGSDFSCVITDDFGKTTELNTDNSYGIFTTSYITNNVCAEQCELILNFGSDLTFSSGYNYDPWLMIYAGESQIPYRTYWQSDWYGNMQEDIIPVSANVPLRFVWHDPDPENHSVWFDIYDPADQQLVYSKPTETILDDGQFATYTPTCGTYCNPENQCPVAVSIVRQDGTSGGDYVLNVSGGGLEYGENEYYMELRLPAGESQLDTTLSLCPQRYFEIAPASPWETRTDIICTVTEANGAVTEINNTSNWTYNNTYSSYNVCEPSCELFVSMAMDSAVSGDYDWQNSPWLEVFVGNDPWPSQVFLNSQVSQEYYTIRVTAGTTMRFVWHEPDVVYHSSHFFLYDPMNGTEIFVKNAGEILADGQFATYTPTCSSDCAEEEKCPMHVELFREANSTTTDYVVQMNVNGMDPVEMALSPDMTYLDTTLMLCENRNFILWTQTGGSDFSATITDAHGNVNTSGYYPYMNTSNPCAQHCYISVQMGAEEQLSDIAEPKWLRVYEGDVESSDFWFNYSNWTSDGYAYISIPVTASNTPWRFVWTEPDPVNFSSFFTIYDDKSGRVLLQKESYTQLPNGLVLEFTPTCEVEPIVAEQVTNITVNSAVTHISVNTIGIENYTSDSDLLCGVCWGTSSNPTFAVGNSSVRNISGIYSGLSVFNEGILMQNLTPNTTYHVRSFVTYNGETIYGNELEFNTLSCTNTEEIIATACSEYPVYNNIAVLSEGFEGGALPNGWTQSGTYWNVGTGDYYSSTGAHSGSYNARITHSETNSVSWLYTPQFDLSSLSDPQLTFWYINRSWGGDIDELAVMCRIAGSSDWQNLKNITNSHSSWTKDVITLPENTVQLAFVMTDRWGYGVGLDDITVEAGQSVGTFTETGTYTYASPNVYGCMDTVILYLTVLNNLPQLYTYSVGNITAESADGWGVIEESCGLPILESGLCYSTEHNPTIAGNHVVNLEGQGGGDFIYATMTGLNEGTTYYVRAYATNSAGTSYGEEVSFTTLYWAALSGTVTDFTTQAPIAGAYVSVYYQTGENNPHFVTSVQTDNSGNYTVSGIVSGNYTVTANASGYHMTNMVSTLQGGTNLLSLSLTPEDCQIPVNVDYELLTDNEGNSLKLNWEMAGDTISQEASTINWGTYGIGNQYSVGVYHLFTPEQLVSYNGGVINSVGAWFSGRYEYTTYTLRIWTGGTEDEGPASGTPAYEQVVSPDGIILNAWNDIPLNTPFVFDGTQCLWVGFQVDCNAQDVDGTIYTIGITDYNNVTSHYGNVIHWYDGEDWMWYPYSGLYYNWMIRAKVVPNALTYNVYENETAIATGVEGNSYVVSPYVIQNQPCYQVAANCVNGQTSALSACATVMQTLPTVVTDTVESVGTMYATCIGEVIDDGNDTILERGFCWSTIPHPSKLNGYVLVDPEGDFRDTIFGLSPQTTYYVRAFATNNLGTAYGNEKVFTTLEECYAPMDLIVSEVVSSSAYISWHYYSENNSAPEYYELQYKIADDENWTTISNITEEYYMLTGLTQQTSYMVQVHAVCGPNRISEYTNSVSFNTSCMNVSAETVIGTPDATTSTGGDVLPTQVYYNYSYTQQIYTAAEIGGAKTIDKIAMQYFYSTENTRNIAIYMGHTDKTAFSGSYDWVPNSDLTLVYSGNITFNNQGDNYWVEMPLTTPFEYNGTGNLLIAFDDNTGSWTQSGAKFRTHNTSESRSIRVNSDGTNYSPSNLSSYTGTVLSYRNNIRIPGSCDATGCDMANVAVRDVTDSSASLLFVSGTGADGIVIEYKMADSEDYNVLAISESPYTLTGLQQNTAYDVRVCSVCGNDTSAWKTTTFTTGVKYVERLYVKSDGTGEGASWEEATNDVAWALSTAEAVYQTYGYMPEIWVAEGVYHGNATASIAFAYTKGTKLYGGFAGNETELSQRDYINHVTVLDGQNTRQVLASQSPTSYSSVNTIIDGFTIRNGYTTSANGGGVYINNGNTYLRNCVITNNYAYHGGGVYAAGGSSNYIVYIDRCTITDNTTMNYGGGLYGMYAKISNSSITNNVSTASYGYGGGIYNGNMDTIINCLIAGNSSYYGAGIYFNYSYKTVINSTIVNNYGPGSSGYYAGVYGSANFVNSVIWGNKVNGTASNLMNGNNFQTSAVEGDMSGYTGVISLQSENLGDESNLFYPAFVSPEIGDYRLQSQSALIDAGTSDVPVDSLDLAGTARFYGDAIDIGCYESHGEVYCTKPYNLAVQDMTGSSAMLIWQNGTREEPDHYELSYKAENEDSWTVVSEELHGLYYMLNGLSPQTNYSVRVRSFCGGLAGTSPYSDVLNFTTTCADVSPEVSVEGTITTTSRSLPVDFYYNNYFYSQQIYKSSELEGVGTIDHLQIQYYYGTSYTRNVEIYLGHTDQSIYTSGYGWVPGSNLTKVYDGSITFTNTGEDYWLDIPLSQSFAYNGTQNLVVMFYDKTGSYNTNSSNKFYVNNSGENNAMYCAGNTLDFDNLSNVYGSITNCRNTLRIPGSCNPNGCPQANITVMDITDSSALVVFSEATGADSYELEYKVAGSANYTSLTVESPYLWTGLRPNTEYTVRIRSLCGDTAQSNWKTASFVTSVKNLNRLYVKTTGTGDASSWQDASNDLAWTMDLALAIKQQFGNTPDVWVAEGTYYGDSVSYNAFTMVDGVNVYGGFVGNEADDYDLSLRDVTAHPTILDGQNFQRVLYQPDNFSNRTLWDGFTLQHGLADYSNNDGYGGAAYLRQNASLRHCQLLNNNAQYGGGAYLYSSNSTSSYYPVLDSCVVMNNTADYGGGGVYAYNAQVLNSTISHNTSISGYGGGVYAYYYSCVDHCVITHNEASNSYGGGVYVYSNSSSHLGISNCLIAHNTSYYYGGGVYSSYYSRIYNSTIVNNQSSYSGAGLYFNNSSSYNRMSNCVVWGNSVNGTVANFNITPTLSHVAVEGGVEGNDEVIALQSTNYGIGGDDLYYPFFVSPGSDDYRLREGSALINAGVALDVMPATDLAGGARVYGDMVDIGCYEFHGEEYCSEPYGLAVEDITGSSAMVIWNNSNMNEPLYYELSYKTADAAEWTVVDQLHVNYYMLNGLQAQTSYMVRVRVACDSEQSSDYTNVVSFSTNCSGDYATELTIGTSTSTDYSSIPFYADYPYSYSQQIFSAEEMGDARTIDTIYLQYFYDSGLSRNISIYLGHTNKSNFEGTSRSDIVTSGFEKVYDGVFSFNNSGDNYWIAIPLQTPFEYNGNDNLVIAFKDSTGNSSDWYTRFYGTYANTNTTVYYYGYYNLDYDHLNNNNGSSYTSWRNNIRFPAKCSEGCDRANLTVTELTDSSALIHYVAGSGSTGYEMAYCESGSNTYITLTPGSSPYLLTGLTQNTAYNIRIRSLCSTDESRWVTRVFHTMPKNLDHLYVSTTGNGDASSWSEASSDLVWTMNTVARIKEEFGTNPVVWVAQGTYYGDSTSANAFTMVEGVNVYGGFEGNETADYDLSLRDFTSHATILDGQYNQRVLCQNDNFDTQTVWDGFTMQHGNALSNNNNGDGGAAYLKANVILRNCNIINNTAYSDGGGVYIVADNNRPAILDHCNISHNTAAYDNGGGVNASYGILRYCTVSYNYAYDYGGGVYVYNTSSNNNFGYTLSNCLIANNSSRYNGAGVHNRSSYTVIANSTIVNNASTNNNYPGAGVYGYNTVNLKNSILWGNKNYGSLSNMAGLYNCQYCATEEVVSGTGNISLMSDNEEGAYFSPHFVNPSLGVGYTDNTDNADWHLGAASVCVNRGDNSLVAAADSLDLDGNARIQVQTVDMGCYESSYDGIILPEYGDIVYVKQGGSGSMDGTSWTNALASVSEALSIAAMYNADVWIAAGTYYGDSISNSAFTMVEGVNVYGGFAGNEPENYNLSLRDFTAHATILDGQNNQRVLYQPNGFSNQHTTWDGFTIQNGNVESNNNSGYGGGAYLRGGVTLNHCIITNNSSYYRGGGVYGESNNTNDSTYLLNTSITYNTARYNNGGGAYFGSKCVADNCVFAYNTASSYNGGGVYNYYSTIRNCTISHNTASNGAGVYNNYGFVSSSVITYNTSSSYGGGLYLDYNSNNLSVANCLVANNTSGNSGAGVFSYGNNIVRSSSIVNNKITGTSSSYQGAGAYSYYNTLTIANSIVWGNQRNGQASGIAGTHVANYVASDDACSGEHNVALMSSSEAMFSPKFVHPSAEAGAADTTSNVDWHLLQGSPCVNRGDNSLAATYDLAGAARIQQDTIDLGCYESPYNSVVLPVYDDIIYVVEGGAGAMTGENWANAMSSIQDAMQIAAINNAVVWVAAGTYQGDGTSENAFVMKPGVSVYGGFAGNETPDYDLSQRNLTTNATVLDGQFSQRVLMQPDHFAANTAVVWDGFTIQNGKVNGNGAGVYMQAYSTLRNCVVQYNIISSATYTSNSRYGAGVYANGNSNSQKATISNCKISYNGFENMSNGYGGGVCTRNTDVSHTEISHNTATNNGGGVYQDYSVYSNCLIFANTTSGYGGGMYLHYSDNSQVVNCDIVNNTSTSSNTNCGGGIYSYYTNQVMTNCIVWGNKKGYVVNNFGSTSMSNVTYCAVEDGYNGTGNITLASSNDGNDGTLYYVRFNDPQNEDYQLHPTSSCVNVGNASVVTDSLDFYGNLRVLGESVDMGCSEVQEESSCTSVINLTASNITTNSAQLSWQPTGEESQWVVMYGMVNGSESTNMTVTETSCTLQNLEFNRNYWAKVRAVCDENMMSIFSIPVNFQTTCDPTVLDTLPNFSNMNPVNDEIIYNSHVNFSWATMANATSYDFYLWRSTESEPSTPSRSGLTQPIVSNYTVPGYGPGITYYWKVVAWNECVSKTSPVMTLQTNKVPDLHVTNVVCSNASLGQSVTVEWTVKNDGEGNTTPGVMWTDYIWLVHDADVRYYDSHDRRLLEIGSLQALNAGESYTNSANVTIPTDIEPGNYFLFVFADQPDAYNPDFSHCPGGVAPVPYEPSVTGVPYPYVTGSVHFEGVIDEVQNHDNFFYILLTILPPPSPDLVVSAITHSTDALSGHEANVSWTVTNQGEAAAMGSWTDAVYLSSDTVLDTENDLRVGRFVHQGPLVINESYQRSEQFTIPVNYSGNYYFIIATDNNNTVYEGLEEMNNKTVSDAMFVTMSWLTDLQVDSVMMSDDVVDANGLYNCSFVVSNKGASPTNVNGWNDVIYISDNPTLNIDNATRLASIRHSGILSAQNLLNPETSMYRVSVNIRIPENITGNWYLHVVTDVDNEVFEYEADDNNVYTYQPALTVLNPDLTVTRIALPDVIDPNATARIQWIVRNEGPGNVVSRSFTDKFFFNGNLLYTASVHDVNISAGDSIVRYATVQIPCVVANSAELTVTTDANTQVLESNENNNSMNVNLSISTPDLVVSGVTPIISSNNTNDALWSGAPAELSYTVTNSGDLAVVGARMTDKIYLSASATSYQASDLIYTNVHSVNLAVDESDTYLCTVTIPNGISGNYYYHVVINTNDSICEGANTGVNEGMSEAVEVMLSPSPDLVITEVTAPSQVYIGAGFQLTYTIQNQGTAAINQSVVQKFYYSTSPTAYDTLKLMATINDYLSMAVNGSVTNVVNLTMPININAGNYYIHMVTDANNQVYEYNGENNNHNHSASVHASTYQLDLQLTQIEGPDVMQWGQTATFTLHIRNNTNLPTLASTWQDVIYLSNDDVLHTTDRLMQSVNHSDVLEGGAEYEVDIQVTIPYGTSSSAYLIAVADFNSNNPDININNNILMKALTINSVPTPDLAVSELVVLDDVYAGQPARLAYKVTNVGEVSITQQDWNDKVFVSYNNTYENIDVQLLNKERRNMTLAPNEFYTDTLTFTIPLPYNGDLYLLMMANAANNPYETVQDNNTAAVAVNVILPLPGDLVVTEVSCERSVVSGQMLHATWTIQNIGDNALAGRGLRSLVYVSVDTAFDANDRLLGSVTTDYINLPIDATMQQSLSGRISGLAEGNYFLIVKTDVTNAFNEVSDNNNTGCSSRPFLVTIRPLPFNTDVHDTVTNNVVSDYMLNVGDQVNQTVRVHVNSEDSAMGAVNMIYATYNNMGSNLNYSYSTIGQYTANSELYIPATQPGYYGVNIYGSTPTNQPQNLIVRADILPFELMGVHDNHGGNTGVTTVELTGSRFRPDMTVCLRNGNEVICADTLIYVNYYQAFAQFDLTGRTPGVYDVSAVNFCEGEAVLSNAFTIENGQPSGLSYNLLFPSSPRPNRNVVLMLEYGNTGNVDLHDQVLEITSTGGSPIALTTDELSQHRTTLRIPLSIEGEPAGLLRPGSYGTINIYCYSSGALIFTIKPVEE